MSDATFTAESAILNPTDATLPTDATETVPTVPYGWESLDLPTPTDPAPADPIPTPPAKGKGKGKRVRKGRKAAGPNDTAPVIGRAPDGSVDWTPVPGWTPPAGPAPVQDTPADTTPADTTPPSSGPTAADVPESKRKEPTDPAGKRWYRADRVKMYLTRRIGRKPDGRLSGEVELYWYETDPAVRAAWARDGRKAAELLGLTVGDGSGTGDVAFIDETAPDGRTRLTYAY